MAEVTRKIWVDGDVVSAEDANRWEEGVVLQPERFAEGETVLEWALSVNTAHAMKYSTLDVCPEDSAERDNGLYEVFFNGKGWRRIEFKTMSWKDRRYFRILSSESEWLQDSGWIKIE